MLSAEELKAIWDRNDDCYGMMQDAAKTGFERGRIAEAEKHDAVLAAVNCVCKSKEKLTKE